MCFKLLVELLPYPLTSFLLRNASVRLLVPRVQTLVGLFGCVLDFISEIRPWIVSGAVSSKAPGPGGGSGSAMSLADLWAMQKLGLECSRVLGVWVAEDPESLPQRFLDALPVLLALNASTEVRVARVIADEC